MKRKPIQVGTIENGYRVLEKITIGGGTGYRLECLTCGDIVEVPSRYVRHQKSCTCGIKARSSKKVIDITGQRFGKLVALEHVGFRSGSALWLCQCDCGQQKKVRTANLRSGDITSCGCVKSETDQENLLGTIEKRKALYYKDGTSLSSLSRKPSEGRDLPKGVSERKGKYIARITFKGVTYQLGAYSTAEEAYAVRLAAEELLYKPVLEGEIVPDYDPYFVRDYAQANACKFL